MSGMTDFLKWALPLQAAKTQEEALHWMKVGHPQESEEDLKQEVAELWEERKRLAAL